MTIIFEGYKKIWDLYSKPKFRKNEEWLRIENSIERKDGSVFYSYPEEANGLGIFDQLRLQDDICPRKWSNPMAWGWMIHWWFESHGPRATKRNLRYFIERGRRGFSTRDTWSFDGYLAKVIADGVDALRENLHGWPGEPLTFEEWQQILKDISEGFRAGEELKWNHTMTDEERKVAQTKYDNGFELFRKWFHHLWD